MSVCICILYKYTVTFTFIYLCTYLETESYVAKIGLAPLISRFQIQGARISGTTPALPGLVIIQL